MRITKTRKTKSPHVGQIDLVIMIGALSLRSSYFDKRSPRIQIPEVLESPQMLRESLPTIASNSRPCQPSLLIRVFVLRVFVIRISDCCTQPRRNSIEHILVAATGRAVPSLPSVVPASFVERQRSRGGDAYLGLFQLQVLPMFSAARKKERVERR